MLHDELQIPDIKLYGLDVYKPSDDSELLLNSIKHFLKKSSKKNNLKFLDLCCGTGIIGITLKLNFKDSKVLCADISDKALLCSILNAFENAVEIHVIKSDMFESIPCEEFDAIFCNPPYLPKQEECIDEDKELDLQTIDDGQIDKFLSNVHRYLDTKGLAYMIVSSKNMPDFSTYMNIMCEIVEEKHFFFEKLYLVQIMKK
ncbi:MAG: methyltransferase [Candidatus Micrarchaeota archaeon]|nr:methyltransferase [Candidatus Micrarchaeota archaeon]